MSTDRRLGEALSLVRKEGVVEVRAECARRAGVGVACGRRCTSDEERLADRGVAVGGRTGPMAPQPAVGEREHTRT